MIDLTLKDYVEWDVKPVLKLMEKGCYAFRVNLIYKEGKKRVRQHSGFKTKKEAEDARKIAIADLVNQRYVVDVTVRLGEFLDFWLEKDIRKRVGSLNTYESYRTTATLHIKPFLGKKRLVELNSGDIRRLYADRAAYSPNVARQTKCVMNVALRYALKCRFLAVNPAEGVPLPKSVGSKPYHTRNIDTKHTLDLEQIQTLLEASKETPIHMQVCFNVLMGLRRQEIIGVKYSDVDYINRTLSIERQLGRKLLRDPETQRGEQITKQELPLKTSSSRRVLPVPDYVYEEILKEREKYESNRRKYGDRFHNDDYICCSVYGVPRSKDYHWPHYKELLRKTGLPDIRWHDLRATYCTLLLKGDFNPKAVSKLMGHAKEIITVDVYGDNKNLIAEEIPELVEYMQEVMPEDGDEEVLDTVIQMEEFLPQTADKGGEDGSVLEGVIDVGKFLPDEE